MGWYIVCVRCADYQRIKLNGGHHGASDCVNDSSVFSNPVGFQNVFWLGIGDRYIFPKDYGMDTLNLR